MVVHKHMLVLVPLAVLLAGCHSDSDDDTLTSSRSCCQWTGRGFQRR